MFVNLDKYADLVEEKSSELQCELFQLRMHNCDCLDYYGYGQGCKQCIRHNLEWLLTRFEGEILEENENAYLKQVVEPIHDLVFGVSKSYVDNHTFEIAIYRYATEDNHHLVKHLSFPVTEEMPFKVLVPTRIYSLKELGI